jgi:hypothetical protein
VCVYTNNNKLINSITCLNQEKVNKQKIFEIYENINKEKNI